MGRSALDEDAIRLIEEHNPEIDFDWTQILRGAPDAAAEAVPPEPPAAGRQGGRPTPQRRRPVESAEPAQTRPAPNEDEADKDSGAAAAEPVLPPQVDVEPLSLTATLDEYDATLAGGEPVPAGGADDMEEFAAPPSAAAARLGPEALLRLRARYAELPARISERVPDPARQERLKADAERLNPDTWVTDDEVREGLEQYESVFESLRAVVGHRRTRRRRRRPAGAAGTGSAGSGNTDEP